MRSFVHGTAAAAVLVAVAAMAAAGGGAAAAAAAGGAKPLPQLNTTSFARCLQGDHARFSLPGEVRRDNLTDTDALLVWLSVYAGERLPFVNRTLQQPAYERWSVPFWAAEERLGNSLFALAQASNASSVVPQQVFSLALEACAAAAPGPPPASGEPGDAFCASLILHNTLRLFGRYERNVDKNGVDWSPAWFVSAKKDWVGRKLPAIHESLVTIRRDNVTERWGSWYHLHGLLAYGLQSAGTMGVGVGTGWEKLVVALDTLLNPLLAGGKEDPVKAAIDQETVQIVVELVRLMSGSGPLPSYSPALCAAKAGYVLAPWWVPPPPRRR